MPIMAYKLEEAMLKADKKGELVKIAAEKLQYQTINEKEKSLHAQIRTEELLRKLVPIDVMRVYFSYAEKVVQDIHSLIKETMPEARSLLVKNKTKEYVKFLQEEVRAVADNCARELLQEIDKDGYTWGDIPTDGLPKKKRIRKVGKRAQRDKI